MKELLNSVPEQKRQDAQNFIEAYQNKEQAPLIAKILMALGAYFAAGFVFSFIVPLLVYYNDLALIISVVIIGLIIYLSKRVKVQGQAMGVFWSNILLFYMLSAKVTLFYGLVKNELFNVNSYFAYLFIITAIVYPLFKSSADRFISVTVTAALAFLSFIPQSFLSFDSFFLWKFLPPDFAISLIFGISLLIFIKGKKGLFPLAYGLVFATVFNLSNLLSTTTMMQTLFAEGVRNVIPFWQIMLGGSKLMALAFALIALLFHYKQTNTSPNIAVIITAALLCLPLNTGCIMGLGFIFVAKYTFNSRLMSFGYVTFAASLSFFYYNLNTTLMQKSGLLVISGLALLGAAWLIGRKQNAIEK